MITNNYLRTMARYNRWQNAECYGVAARLTEQERLKDRGAFFGSIQTTLSHIYWADRIWLSRFDLVDAPDVPIAQSAHFVSDFEELSEKRVDLDETLIAYCDGLAPGAIKGNLTWFSGAIGKEATAPLSVIFTHLFNHQTHHRGQVHAMLTSTGAKTSDTDLFLMPADLWPTT